jgi:acyl carrier protein
MTSIEFLSPLLRIARDVLDSDQLAFDEQTPFEDIEEWDSMSHIHMVVAMERAFDIRFEATELQNVAKVGDLLDIIAKLKGA